VTVLSGRSESSADLIVVGSVRSKHLGGRILGSVPQGVARRARVDVLIVAHHIMIDRRSIARTRRIFASTTRDAPFAPFLYIHATTSRTEGSGSWVEPG